jgi:hypothetical protein
MCTNGDRSRIATEAESRNHVARSNVELNAAARGKDEFPAMLPHELPNPHGAQRCFAELLHIMTFDEEKCFAQGKSSAASSPHDRARGRLSKIARHKRPEG